jgi:hypothetical protein
MTFIDELGRAPADATAANSSDAAPGFKPQQKQNSKGAR